MDLGVSLPVAGGWATPENLLRVARHAEELGYHGLWTFQRLLYALAPRNEYPGAPGQPWPQAFQSVMDPVVALAYVAAATRRIRLGTSVLIVPYYAPIVLAKQLATLDQVAGGRLDVGLGTGWSRDEYEAVGVPYERRARRVDEFLRCLSAIWTEDTVEFEGEFYRIPRCRVEPKPVQKPRPPITVGGYGPFVVRRAVTLADGFNGGNVPFAGVVPIVTALREAAAAHGRDMKTLHVVCRGTFRVFDQPRGPDRRPLWGTLDEIRDDIRRYAELGLTQLFLEANFDPDGASVQRTLAVMDALAPGRRSYP